jgi:hypothetical protein
VRAKDGHCSGYGCSPKIRPCYRSEEWLLAEWPRRRDGGVTASFFSPFFVQLVFNLLNKPLHINGLPLTAGYGNQRSPTIGALDYCKQARKLASAFD